MITSITYGVWKFTKRNEDFNWGAKLLFGWCMIISLLADFTILIALFSLIGYLAAPKY